MKQIIEVDWEHTVLLLLRMRLKESEYINHLIYVKWNKFQSTILINLITLFICTLIGFKFLSKFSLIYGRALMIDKVYQFVLMLIITYVLLDFTCNKLLIKTICSHNKTLQLLCEYKETLDKKLDPEIKSSMIKYYTSCYNYSRIYIRFSVWSNLWESFFYAIFCAFLSLSGINTIIFGTITLMDSGYFYRLFYFKMKQSIKCLFKCFLLSQQHHQLERFIVNYTKLHREILMYNWMIREQIQLYDIEFKIGGSIVLSIFASQGNISTNNTAMMILSFYATTYISMNCVFMILAYFPNANLHCYCLFVRIASKSTTKPMYKGNIGWKTAKQIRYLLRINLTIQFLAQSQIGFTNSTLYLLRKICLICTGFCKLMILHID
ncbi:hypothetical protein BLOT_016699 [Blomia tropicalis]|nr:hypothetical protein BLOT_016699 [Blomia tropicalis]